MHFLILNNVFFKMVLGSVNGSSDGNGEHFQFPVGYSDDARGSHVQLHKEFDGTGSNGTTTIIHV